MECARSLSSIPRWFWSKFELSRTCVDCINENCHISIINRLLITLGRLNAFSPAAPWLSPSIRSVYSLHKDPINQELANVSMTPRKVLKSGQETLFAMRTFRSPQARSSISRQMTNMQLRVTARICKFGGELRRLGSILNRTGMWIIRISPRL